MARRRRPAPAERRILRVCNPSPEPARALDDLLAPPQTLATESPEYLAALAQGFGLAQDAALPIMGLAAAGFGGYCEAFTGLTGSHGFIGYPLCAELAQYGLMQAGVETLADEMTRKFPQFTGPSDGDSADAAAAMNKELDRLNVRARFHRMAEFCGYFGGGLLYMRLRGAAGADLAKPISISPEYIGRDSLEALVPVEPISVGPLAYNSTDPLRNDYFQPNQWFVTGTGPVHASRFLRFIKNEPPLILRPAYNFLGIPDVQTAWDYLLHFTETRESAARLLKKFSLTVIKTNADAVLYGGDDSDVRKRIAHLARERDNDGVYAINYDDEDMVQLNTPLAGVTDIVRQSLELLACVWRIPVVKFLGVSPGGMNATGESDIRSFYDHVGSQREKIFGHPLEQLAKVMQLSLFGEIRDDLSYAWPSLWEVTERERSEVAKINADTDAIYLDRGVVDQEAVRAALASDKGGRFAGIDPEAVPDPPPVEQDVDTPLSGLPGFAEEPVVVRNVDRAGEVPE